MMIIIMITNIVHLFDTILGGVSNSNSDNTTPDRAWSFKARSFSEA